MDECDGIPPGWRGIVEDVGAGVMRAAAACAGPCSVAFEFEVVAGRLAMTWGCRLAPALLRRRMVDISAEAHRRSAVICEACGEAGDRSAGRTLCVRHRVDA